MGGFGCYSCCFNLLREEKMTSSNTKKALIYSGIGLIGVGVAPTPDDITIISPALQIGLGAILLTVGLLVK